MHGPLVGVNNLGKDNFANVGNNLVPIQRRGLMGFSEPKTEGFAVPKTVNYESLSLKFGYGLAAFIIANRLALWVKLYNVYRKGSDSDHSGKIGEEFDT